MKYKIALGVDMGTVENRELEWNKITERLAKHSVAVVKGGRYFVGGQFADERRQETSLLCRSLLTIDIDKVPEGVDIFDLESDLLFSVPYAFVAYSTFSHTPDTPRIRLIVPLSRDVTPGEYREVSRDFVNSLSDIVQGAVDNCSFVPNQFMYMPICPDLSAAWSYVQDGDPYPVPDEVVSDYAKGAVKRVKPAKLVETAPAAVAAALASAAAVEAGEGDVEADIDDLADAVANEPLNLSDDEVDAYLRVYKAEGLEYDQWLMVGAALNHQYRRSETGYQRWLAWSKQSSKHDSTQMRAKWRSFGKGTTHSVVTFASVIFLAKEMGDAALREDRDRDREGGDRVSTPVPTRSRVEHEAFEALAEAASDVDSVETYDAFKARLQRISLHILPVDKRSMLAQEVYDGWGKGKGLSKSDIKAAIMPPKAGKGALAASEVKRDVPEWLDGWVYIGVPAEFYNMRDHYALKREAFDSFYGREVEVVAAELPASKVALNDYRIDTLVDLMFWPGAGITFEYEGKRMLNTYRETGIGPCVEMDADGEAVVDLFMRHVRFMLADESEQRLLVDFLAWVVQNPGQKINWSLVLQGAQGVGKSYFGHVMMLVLGDMARNVEPSSLAGRFTGWAHGATLAIIEEIRVTGENRYEIIDRLKPFISNATIQIEEKGRDHRTVPNFTTYLMFTNHKDALPLGAGDRRYAPLFSRVQSEEMLFAELGGEVAAGEYFAKLFGESERRADALSRFLRDWQVSGEFNAKGRAPHTRARDMMMGLAISPERCAVEDAIAKYSCGVIGGDILDVTWLQALCDLDGVGEVALPKTRALSAILLDMGYEAVEGRRVWIGKTKSFHYVWQKAGSGQPLEVDAKEVVKSYHDGK